MLGAIFNQVKGERAMTYKSLYGNETQTPPHSRTPGRTDEVKNRSGAYGFKATKWTRLNRFLILGSEGSTYYIKAQKLTAQNAQNVIALIKEDGPRVVNTIVEISQSGRAPKNAPALFALALCAKHGDVETRSLAYKEMPKVARTTTHFTEWVEYCKNVFGIGGAGFRKAGARWYTDRSPASLAYQVVKYRNRNGWTHKNLLQVFHPVPQTDAQAELFYWIAKGWDSVGVHAPEKKHQRILWGYERAQFAHETELITLIRDHELPWEAVPTQMLSNPAVWEALLETMQPEATLRNLNKMTSIGLLTPFSDATTRVVNRFLNAEEILASRLHPFKILVGLRKYAEGYGDHLRWTPVAKIIDALNEAFYLAFGNVEPSGKNIMFACDVSGSMTFENCAGLPFTPRVGTAALALIGARTEPNSMITAFSSGMVPFNISPRERLDDVMYKMDNMPFSSTNISAPMLNAFENRYPIDTFVILTDNEHNSGIMKPYQALDMYNDKMGRTANLAVVSMTPDKHSIADPTRNDMLDIAGLDTAVPDLISTFAKGEI